MQVTVDVRQGLERQVIVEIPIEEVEKEVKDHIKNLQLKLKLPGFRPGKVPESVVRRHHGEAIYYEVADKLSRQTAPEAIKQANLEPLTRPSIEIISPGIDGPLKYNVIFEIQPEFQLADMSQVEIEKLTSEITPEKIEDAIQTLRTQQATWKEVERAAKDGDKITIDFEGTINGEAFKGGAANGFDLILGKARMIPGFEDKLIGAKAGDDVTIKVTFPADYHAEELAGKAAEFATKVKKVSEIELPEINEDLAKKCGIVDGNVDTLREQLKQHLQRELDKRLLMLNKEKVLKKMLELHEFDMPQKLLQDEIQDLKSQSKKVDEDAIRQRAETRVKLSILINKYAKEHDLKADDDSVRKLIEEEASLYEKPSQMLKWLYEKPERLTAYAVMVLENKVVNHIFDKVKTQTKHLPCDEVMQMQSSL